jgi:hypothetical protein
MTSILVYTKADTLEHKRGVKKDDPDKSPVGMYYWQLTRKPKELRRHDRLYFAVDKQIKGSFEVEGIAQDEGEEPWYLTFHSLTWTSSKIGDTYIGNDVKPFQGFKYLRDGKTGKNDKLII